MECDGLESEVGTRQRLTRDRDDVTCRELVFGVSTVGRTPVTFLPNGVTPAAFPPLAWPVLSGRIALF